MTTPGLECPYEASDEASESELLDRSLSVWRGRGSVDNGDEFAPIRLDLHTASSIGQYDSVRTIIQRQEEDLNAKNRGGWTALMYASYIGHDNVVNLLLDARVQVNVKNNKGQTPLMLAASCGNESVAYFLLQQGAELEARDRKGWTALFHATYSGHQNMVKFLLENNADMEAREPVKHYTPFMIASQEGHEIIVQYFLQHGVSVDAKACNDNARTLALIHGHMKIVSLIDNYAMGITAAPRAEPGLRMTEDLSSSDEAVKKPPRHCSVRPGRKSSKGPSIRDGPDAFAKMMGREKTPSKGHSVSDPTLGSYVPKGYMTFKSDNVPTTDAGQIRSRDVTSPINAEDHTGSLDSSGSREFQEYDDDTNAFSKTGALTIKSSSSSSGGLIAALGISHHSTDEDTTHSDPGVRSRSPSDLIGQGHTPKGQTTDITPVKDDTETKVVRKPSPSPDVPRNHTPTARVPPFPPSQPPSPLVPTPSPSYPITPPAPPHHIVPYHGPAMCAVEGYRAVGPGAGLGIGAGPGAGLAVGAGPGAVLPAKSPDFSNQGRPQDLESLLRDLGLLKYLVVFEEQDVDLPVFLSLTDNDLKEVGIGKFGPRRKMTNAIARWHSNATLGGCLLEQAYADKLEAGMQEMAIQLNQAYEQVEQFKAQVRQERELRSVAESCLMHMEDQSSDIATDIRQRCLDVQENIKQIRCYSEELSSRLCQESTYSEENSLVKAINQGLSLEEKQSDLTNQIKQIPSAQIAQHIRGLQEDMWRSVAITVLNTEKLVKNVELGKVRDGFS